MPKKNGIECLSEIKSTEKLRLLPVVIISTSVLDDVADLIYEGEAHYYVRKTDMADLKKNLLHVLTLLAKNKFFRPARNKFVLSLVGI
jgi:CheY-like chemotaxis protein